ncbi:FHA domain-containing protein [Dictyobacter alpinus]|nr:FHA domain-containing protein [Dictyobacter alpinus]
MPLNHKPAHLVVLASGQSIPLDAPPMTVGRRDDTQIVPYPDINFNDRSVGRRHAIIDKQEGYTIEDLNTPNGTRLNSVLLTPKQKYPLHDGDILKFGAVQVRFEHEL